MLCKKCGHEINEEAKFCEFCGAPIVNPVEFKAKTSEYCGESQNIQQKSRIAAAVFALTFGTLGIHDFYLGRNSQGYIKIALTVCSLFTCGLSLFASGIWSIIDAIQILSNKDAKDASGIPLRG